MHKSIIPTTIDQLPGLMQLSSGLSSNNDYYIKDLVSLKQWEDLETSWGRAAVYPPDFHLTRVWCPLNSFNMPSPSCEPNTFLCLQGAGDLFMSTSFMRYLPPQIVYTYDKFRNIIEDNPDVSEIRGIALGNPHDYDFCRLRSRCEYTVSFPLAVRSLWKEAVESGWDHYRWKRFMLGLPWRVYTKPGIVTRPQDTDSLLSHFKHVAAFENSIVLHLASSSIHRSAMFLLNDLLAGLPNAHFTLLGGEESAHIPSSKRLLNLAGRLTYKETYELVGIVRTVVAVDSVVLHMASARSGSGITRILGLYGYTPPSWGGPGSPHLDTIHAKGIDKIRPKEVVAWVKMRLSS